MIVFLNPQARQGRGVELWSRFARAHPPLPLYGHKSIVTDPERLDFALIREARFGEGHVIAAGGDGTVHFVINRIMELPPTDRDRLVLGTVGLGSSNDFLKPIPVNGQNGTGIVSRLDWSNPQSQSVGRVHVLTDGDAISERIYFAINFSVGITADANRRFNESTGLVRSARGRSTATAIWFAGLESLFLTPNQPATVEVCGDTVTTRVTNLHLLLNPHVSGTFCYNLAVTPASRHFAFALCENMGVPRRLRTLFALSRGKFIGLPGTRHATCRTLKLRLQENRPYECDGEIRYGKSFRVDLLPNVLRVCS